MVDAGVCAASLLGVNVEHVICGFNLFIYFSSQLCCPLRFQGSSQTLQWECFLVFGNFSLFKDSLPRTDLCPYLFCLSFYLLHFFLPPFEDNGCFSECLMSSVCIQKLFCGIYSAFKCSFDEFVGEKVVSLSYFSTTLGLTPKLFIIPMRSIGPWRQYCLASGE